jgi:autotransporter translocation and assembly factor TamB
VPLASVRRTRPWLIAVLLLGILSVAAIERQAILRGIVEAAASALLHVRVAVSGSQIGWGGATLTGVRVTSDSGEPIARIARLQAGYDLGALVHGTRLYGLTALVVDRPHVTIVRHRDGSLNVPIPKMPSGPSRTQAPARLSVTVTHGSVDVVNQRENDPALNHLYVRNLTVRGRFARADWAYTAALSYGERAGRLYSVRGAGRFRAGSPYALQQWSAPELPIAAAADFALGSPALRIAAGTLYGLDARIFAFGAAKPQFAASAQLRGGKIDVGGLSVPVENVHGRIDADGAGLTTRRLRATLGGIAARISGGVFDLTHPQVRMAIRGSGRLGQLRAAFAQAKRLPVSGRITFAVLAEGAAGAPTEWIALHSPRVSYASSSVTNLRGLIAFDGREADVTHLDASYRGVDVTARGRAGLHRRPHAIEMLMQARAAPGAIAAAQRFAPSLSLQGTALATAADPKRIALRGVLTGNSPSIRLAGIFDVGSDGTGSLGPFVVAQRRGPGTLYLRATLDRPHQSDVAIWSARNLTFAHAGVLQSTGVLALRRGVLRGDAWGTLRRGSGESRLSATIAGTAASPRAGASVLLDGARYRGNVLRGTASMAFAGGTLAIRDALAQLGPVFVQAGGDVAGLNPRRLMPHYHLAVRVQSSDVAALIADAKPPIREPIQGSLDAALRIGGSGSAPVVSGAIAAPEGSVNGLAFRALSANVDGGPGAIAVSNGRVTVGTTVLHFDAGTRGTTTRVALRAAHADLADFNDFFDTGDTLGGRGSTTLAAAVTGKRVIASTGYARFAGARYRQIDLGTVAARWHASGSAIAANLAFGGAHGEIRASGTLATTASGSDDLRATARGVDLATWLPALGMQLPVTGRLDAQVAMRGQYPDLAMQLHAAVFGATVDRVPVRQLSIAATMAGGHGRIESARIVMPALTTVASGTFGLHPGDRLALTARTTSPNVGTVATALTGKRYGVSGTLQSVLRVGGTRAQPRLLDDVAVKNLHYNAFTVPSVTGEIAATRTAVAVRNVDIALPRGRLLLAASMPVRLSPHGAAVRTAPLHASLIAQDLEAADAAPLFPKGTRLGGRIDGHVGVSGTLDAPQFAGQLTLTGGSFIGPMERAPIKALHGVLLLHGRQVALQGLHADVGGGSVAADGTASLADLRSLRGLAFSLHLRADNAHLEMPAYFQGNLNAALSLARSGSGPIGVGGQVAVDSARIPLSAFYNPKAAKQPPRHLPPVTFDNLRIHAGRDVRVQSGEVDIGGRGLMTIDGSLAKPVLAGAFHSTGGTISFYHTFTVQRGRVSFAPGAGLTPYVNAVATTYVANPPTAIRMHVSGPVSQMQLALASDPSYDRAQILGLLTGVNQIGAVRGVASNGASGGFSLAGTAQNVALGQVNQAFTRQLLEPLSSSLGASLGFNNLQITNDLQSGLGINAVKAFGNHVTAAFSETFGTPKVQSVALEAHPSIATGLRLRLYSTAGPSLVGITQQQQPVPVGLDVLNLNPMTSIANPSGTNGVDFSYERKFP